MEAYPILANRELKSLTDNPFFSTAMPSLSPLLSRHPILESLRGSSREGCQLSATMTLALCTYAFTIWPRVPRLALAAFQLPQRHVLMRQLPENHSEPLLHALLASVRSRRR